LISADPVMISSVKGRCLINYNLNGGIATPPPLNVTPSVEQQCRDIRGDGPRQRPFPALPGGPPGRIMKVEPCATLWIVGVPTAMSSFH
jgi:hypothetical protein